MHLSHYWQVGKPVVKSRRGIVTAQNMTAAEAGANILGRGGNAVDAAVGTCLALAAVEPWMSGLGGGGFMVLYRAADRTVHAVDFSLISPRCLKTARYPLVTDFASDRDMFGWPQVVEDRNLYGYESICTPGTVDGLGLALERFGTMDWADVLAPAIQLSEDGLALDWFATLAFAHSAAELKHDAVTRERIMPGGFPPAVSLAREPARLRFPELAQTLRRLAEAGPRDFYEGRLAAQVVAEIREGGGCLNAEDLKNYHAAVKKPLSFDYGNATAHTVPGLSGGPTLAATLESLNGRLGRTPEPGADAYQAYARALQEAYRVRLADLGHAGLETCTSHVNAVDNQGNMVTLTNTLLARFGSKVLLPRTGIFMNNGIMWFDPRPGRPNSLSPGVRPLANMCPTLLTRNGCGWVAMGAAGGRQIVPAVAQLVSFIVDYGFSLEAALHQPRIDVSSPLGITCDFRLPAEVVAALSQVATVEPAQPTVFPVRFSVPSAVSRDAGSGWSHGQADPNQPLSGAAEAGAA